MPTTREITDWKGLDLVGEGDEKLGTIDDIYLDDETGEPEWVAVKTGLLGSRVHFVPIADAARRGDRIHVPYRKDVVKDAPNAEADGTLSRDEERALYRHYGFTSSDAGYGDDDVEDREGRFTTGRDTSGPTTDDAMTRSEEELEVGTTRRESGRARLRKYVVTEEQTVSVPVQREEVRIEREAITDGNVDDALEGPAISEEEHEVVLHAEEPVVEKRAVPKERVRLETDTVTEERTVRDEVRKERIEVEDDGERRA